MASTTKTTAADTLKAAKNSLLNAQKKAVANATANHKQMVTQTTPEKVETNNYKTLYSAYEQAMNGRANAYNAQNAAQASDAARQLQIVGNQGKTALQGTQGVRGQDVSETSLLQNEMSTGTTAGGVKSAYDAAMREVGIEKDQNLAETDRIMGNQQVNYENSLQDLATQYSRDVDDFNNSVEHNDKITDIQERGEYATQKRDIYDKYATDYDTIAAYNKAINRLANDGKVKSDWKIQYLTEKRDALQAEIDKQKLADTKNAYSKSLKKYTSVSQVDNAIAKILADGDTSNDWKLSYLNKYRTILNRWEKNGKSGSSGSSKKSGSSGKSKKSGSKSGNSGNNSGNGGGNKIQKAAEKYVKKNPKVATNSATVDSYLAASNYNADEKEAFKYYMQQAGAPYIRRG